MPRTAPAVSIITSLILGPRPGTKTWIVSSIQAVRIPAMMGYAQCSNGLVRSIPKNQRRHMPRQANSVKWASFRSRPPPPALLGLPPDSRASNSLTQSLKVLDTVPGSRELHQMKARFSISSATHRRSLFFVRIIPGSPYAPGGP